MEAVPWGVRIKRLADRLHNWMRLPMKLIQQVPAVKICSATATARGIGRIDTARLNTTSISWRV